MSHQLKIKGTADFNSITREVKRLSGTIDDAFGKDGVKMLDDKSLKFLKSEASQAIGKMHQQMSRLSNEAKELDKQIESAVGNEKKQNNLIQQRMVYTQRIVSLNRQMNNMSQQQTKSVGGGRMSSAMSGAGGALRAVGGAAGRVASSIPGIGGIAGAASGVGSAAAGAATVGAAVAMGSLAAAAGGAILAFSRMSTAFEVFSQSVPKMITRTAIGLGDLSGRERENAIGLGFRTDETIQTQVDMARAFGTNRSSKEQENMLMNTQMAGRALGVEPGQIAGMGNQLRATMGTEGASSSMAQILSKAISSGMDKSQATHYLQATTGAIQEINKNGMLSNDALIGAMAELSRGNNIPPEQAARVLGGMQSAMTGSSGESNSFFQMAMSRKGIGAGSLMGAQMGVETGLFGIDEKQYLKMTGGDKQGLSDLRGLGLTGGVENTRLRAQGILEQSDSQGFDTSTASGRLAKTRYLGQQFGAQNPQDQAQIESILERLAETGIKTEEDKKLIDNMGKDPAARWREESLAAMKTIAGEVAKFNARKDSVQFGLGKDSASTMMTLGETMNTLDSSINRLITAIEKDGIVGGIKEAGNMVGEFLFGKSDEKNAKKNSHSGFLGFNVSDLNNSVNSMSGGRASSPEAQKDPNTPMVQVLTEVKDAIKEGNEDRKKGLQTPRGMPRDAPKIDKRRHGG